MKRENNRSITIYLFRGDRKKKYAFSSAKVRFIKGILWFLVTVFVVSILLNILMIRHIPDYISYKRGVEKDREMFRRITLFLDKKNSQLLRVTGKIWKLSLTGEEKRWEGGDPEATSPVNLRESVRASLDEIGGRIENLESVTGELYRIFTSSDSPYQWIPNASPVTGEVAIPYGEFKDPFTQKVEQHNGIGIVVPFGTPVKAAASGRIVYVGRHPRYGKIVKISHGFGLETVYGHLGWIKYPEGHYVKKGEVFATTGNTGKLIEPLLYFEIDYNGKPVDPGNFILSGQK